MKKRMNFRFVGLFAAFLALGMNLAVMASQSNGIVAIDSTVYFIQAGVELWKTDGTTAGTVLIKNFGIESAFAYGTDMINVKGILYFPVLDKEEKVIRLWKSDGTEKGTTVVCHESDCRSPYGLTDVHGRLFFGTIVNKFTLWTSDGTEKGTRKIKDIPLAPVDTTEPWDFTDVNGMLYFGAGGKEDFGPYDLWKSDGTTSGTQIVRAGIHPQFLTRCNGKLFFSGSVNGENTCDLWKSDGTTEGTVKVKDICLGRGKKGGPGTGADPHFLTDVSGVLYFSADDGNGHHLWKSDGTASGTTKVGAVCTPPYIPPSMNWINVNGTLFFIGLDQLSNYMLWKSDGTAEGTVQVNKIHLPINLTNANGTLFFYSGGAIWKSDGTAEGTKKIKAFPLLPVSYSMPLTHVDGTIFFRAWDPVHEYGVWKSDGTTAGTTLIENFTIKK